MTSNSKDCHRCPCRVMASMLGCIVALTIVFTGGCAMKPTPDSRAHWIAPNFHPAAHPKLAVVVEDRTNRLPDENSSLRQIEDAFNQAFLTKGYRVAARSDIEKISKEMKFQHSGWTDADAAELGKMLNIGAVVIVSVVEFRRDQGTGQDRFSLLDGTYERGGPSVTTKVSARIVSVELGELLGQSAFGLRSYTSNEGEANATLVHAANSIATEFPEKATAIPTQSPPAGE